MFLVRCSLLKKKASSEKVSNIKEKLHLSAIVEREENLRDAWQFINMLDSKCFCY